MAGDSPADAVDNFATPLRRVADLVTDAILFPSGYHVSADGTPHALAFSELPFVTLRGTDVRLDFRHQFRVTAVDDEERGPFKVSTAGYLYAFVDRDGRELIAFHWHPESNSPHRYPHIHLPQHTIPFDVSALHFPSPRISFEYVVQMAIEKFGARVRNGADYEGVLRRTSEAFERYRTWG